MYTLTFEVQVVIILIIKGLPRYTQREETLNIYLVMFHYKQIP